MAKLSHEKLNRRALWGKSYDDTIPMPDWLLQQQIKRDERLAAKRLVQARQWLAEVKKRSNK